MIAANDIRERSIEIQRLIAADEMGRALRRLMDFVTDFSDNKDDLNEVTVLTATYTRVEGAQRTGILLFPDYLQQRTKLLYQALQLRDKIESATAATIAA
jgi:hypothetical protein